MHPLPQQSGDGGDHGRDLLEDGGAAGAGYAGHFPGALRHLADFPGQGAQAGDDLPYGPCQFRAGVLQLRRLQSTEFGGGLLRIGGFQIGQGQLCVHQFLPHDVLELDGRDHFADMPGKTGRPGGEFARLTSGAPGALHQQVEGGRAPVQQFPRLFLLPRLDLGQSLPGTAAALPDPLQPLQASSGAAADQSRQLFQLIGKDEKSAASQVTAGGFDPGGDAQIQQGSDDLMKSGQGLEEPFQQAVDSLQRRSLLILQAFHFRLVPAQARHQRLQAGEGFSRRLPRQQAGDARRLPGHRPRASLKIGQPVAEKEKLFLRASRRRCQPALQGCQKAASDSPGSGHRCLFGSPLREKPFFGYR